MEPRTFAGFLVAIAAVVVIAVLSYDSLRETHVRSESLARTVEVLAQIQGLVSTLKDAETGQRGYLLTGRESYLEPFLNAKRVLPDQFVNLRALLGDDPAQRTHLDTLQALANDKLNELMDTVQLRRAGQTEAAMALVLTDRGKNSMDRIRAIAAEMTRLERQLVGQRTQEWRRAATSAFWITSVGSLVLLLLIVVAAAMTSRDFKARQRESWLRAGQIGLSELMQGDLPLEQLGENVLRFLTHYLDAQVGALFVADGAVFRRVAGHALPAGDVAPMRPGDGLAGQSAKDNRLIRVRGVPPDYLPIGSGTGRSDAAELLISPAAIDQRVYAVIELGFFGSIGSGPEELLSRVSEPVAAAIRASRDRFRLEELLQETQQQAEELQTREEELRVNNEELEEQGRTLRESRAQLESQQAELEQINSQLEEQAQALEDQRDSLARSHATMASKSLELQRANEYKSEFLANMSHELRTPLNSTLILAKLLADNKEGNLTESQVKYAQTISAAGNDLLALINDVLDLSRIEAGRIDVMPETLSLAHAIEPLIKMFEPASGEKNLKFGVVIEPDAPKTIETDPQRLGQILKNLLSNALKFTHQGEIGLRIFTASPGTVSFAVHDTGVGIEPHQHEVIFEAFRQADGSIHRKFGGTGLGLSISKDLARLLGGGIVVDSRPGAGSTFTLTLPVKYTAPAPAAERLTAPRSDAASTTANAPLFKAPAPAGTARTDRTPGPGAIPDDRESLIPGKRLILVVEDDVPFASILRDLAQEMGFQCVVVQSRRGRLDRRREISAERHSSRHQFARLFRASACSISSSAIRAPGTSPCTWSRSADYRREALELGRRGYALKPAKREELHRGPAAPRGQAIAERPPRADRRG